MKYARIALTDGARFVLRITSETETTVSGIEVDMEGEEVVPRGDAGYHNRLRIVDRGAIRKLTPLRMNVRYAMLEVEVEK